MNKDPSIKTEETAEVPSPGEQGADAAEKKKRRRRIALIFILILLIAAAILVPLAVTLTNRSGGKITRAPDRKIVYCGADFESDVWKNEEYVSLSNVRTVRATVRETTYERSYFDRESAFAAIGGLADLPDGGELFAAYFSCLLRGSKACGEKEFSGLFASGYAGRVPTRFPAQKLTSLVLTYQGEDADAGYFEWRADFSIMNNDGLAVDYFDARDLGSVRFCLGLENGEYRIAEIHTIVHMN